MADFLTNATKDELILAMLAVLGGETRDVNERDLFRACWHAFPNTMRWVDTPLPNPETYAASLRRLDQRGVIVRQGKAQRKRGRKGSRSKGVFEAGRSGVVKARIADGGLEQGGVTRELVEEVRRLVPDRALSRSIAPAVMIALCIGLRESEGRELDEGVLAELAFHKFPDRFAFDLRPEFPDLERIRQAARAAIDEGLCDQQYVLTDQGRETVRQWQDRLRLRTDSSESYKAGDLKLADRLERSAAYQLWIENGTLATTKPDELFRALRIPPTVDPKPIADALAARIKAVRRIDKGELADYLLEVARRHNPEVATLVDDESAEKLEGSRT